MKLKPEDFRKIEDKQLANVLRKLHEGKTLTAREEAILVKARAENSQTPGAEPETSGYVGTWDDLAAQLGVTRRAIQDWRSDPRYEGEIQKRRSILERADGRHCVAEWRRLMVDLHLKRGKAAAEAEGSASAEPESDDVTITKPPRYGGTQNDWTKAKIAKEVQRKEIEILELTGVLIEAADLELPLGATFAAIQTKLVQFPARVARYLVGIRDISEMEDRLRDEIDADLGDLNAARFAADAAVAEAVAALPFDADSERLFTAVCFSGQDRAALLQLVTAVATQALRLIGRAAIATAQREEITPDVAIAEEDATDVGPTSSASAVSPPSVPAASMQTISAGSTGAESVAKRRRKPRPKPATAPAEVEAAIVNKRSRRKATRRKRR